jgi:hypothetical protein
MGQARRGGIMESIRVLDLPDQIKILASPLRRAIF